MFEVLESTSDSEVHSAKNDQAYVTMYESIYHVYVEKHQWKHPHFEPHFAKYNRDVWAVLVAKSEGEAWEKSSGVCQGEGLWAYVRMHRWFKQAIEQGVINRRTAIINPEPIVKDHELAGAVERWEEKISCVDRGRS